MAKLTIQASDFELVYGWFEERTEAQVDVWGLEFDRPVALLAYRSGADDAFGWSNWVRAIYEDPSDICGLFERMGLALDDDGVAADLRKAFPGRVIESPAPTTA